MTFVVEDAEFGDEVVFKLFMPVLIILVCSDLALLIDPTPTKGRVAYGSWQDADDQNKIAVKADKKKLFSAIVDYFALLAVILFAYLAT